MTVASVQSLSRPDRLEKFAPKYFTDVVIDEAHHSLSDSYRRVIDHFCPGKAAGRDGHARPGRQKESIRNL